LRDVARSQVAAGIYPSHHKQTEKRAREAEAYTFEKLANEWYAYSAPRWAEATAYKARLYLDNDIIPGIGKRPVGEITRPEVVELVRKVEARGSCAPSLKVSNWITSYRCSRVVPTPMKTVRCFAQALMGAMRRRLRPKLCEP